MQKHGPHVTPEAWEYILLTQKNQGKLTVFRPNGNPEELADQHFIIALNHLGRDGWEVVQGGVNPDSSGTSYLLKRRG